MLFQKTLLAALAGVAAAAPHEARTGHSERIQANWDDVDVLPLLPILYPTGKYKQLDFTGFEIVPTGLGGFVLTGLETKSKPNAIASGLQAQLLTGPAQIVPTEGVESFDLEEFYFGCVLDTVVSLLSVAPGCKVTVVGYNKAGEGVANQEFEFVGTGLLNKMKKAELSDDFKNLDRVQFTTDSTLTVLTATLFDSFRYTVHYKH